MPRPSSCLAASAAVLALTAAGPACAADPPSLVVVVVVDQMRADYVDRFGAEFTGGLGRLFRTGIRYTDAHQDHAVTETAPGHATVLSGRSPASTGIVANRKGVSDPSAPLLGVDGAGASPHRFRGTALLDWIRVRHPDARALSVSRKDRGAILPIGRARADVYWLVRGRFTTSTWYADSLPAWLASWNARRGAARLAGTQWELSRPAGSYPEPDSMAYEYGGGRKVFPHPFPTDTSDAEKAVGDSPWADSLTLDVALDGARVLQLGRRRAPDLLVVSLSATDIIGHRFGPDSREVHDQLLRLDRWLGTFLDSLAVLVPRERTVLALTADHGVLPFPERSGTGGRASIRSLMLDAERRLEGASTGALDFDFDSGLITADVAAIRAMGVNLDSLSSALARDAAAVAGVGSVYTPATLAAAPAADEEARLWRKLVPEDGRWLLAASLRSGWQWGEGSGGTTHGSTARDDTHVPIVFVVPGRPAGSVASRVTTEDIGPTLAALVGVAPTEAVTGRVLPEVAGPGSQRR
ncbi:MAG: alkaline phosphatase family protein [Gemmatimonadales bacterium]|nr:alkaline phosphatase family protein [Gemmatimonadales bacterium]